MQTVSTLRTTIQNLMARSLGVNRQNTRYFSGQKLVEVFQNTPFSLPAVAMDPIQDLNPSSPTYGSFYFMVGYDGAGDDSKPVSP